MTKGVLMPFMIRSDLVVVLLYQEPVPVGGCGLGTTTTTRSKSGRHGRTEMAAFFAYFHCIERHGASGFGDRGIAPARVSECESKWVTR